MPVISVIVPVYRVEQYINRCVDSILAQTLTDFELILIDDGSPDKCGSICEEYASKDDRVHVIHQKNGGLSAARNTGIDWAFANSDSKWLTFIDSDDWVHCRYLEMLYSAACKYHTHISICNYERTAGENLKIDESALRSACRETETYFMECRTNAVVAWGKLYSKTSFRDIRYPVGRIHEDEFTTHKLLFQYSQIAEVPAPLYAYFDNPKGITGVQWTPKRLDKVLAVEEQISYFGRRKMKTLKIYTIGVYLYVLEEQMKILDKIGNNQYKKEYKWVVNKLRAALIKYKKTMGFSFTVNAWRYDMVFPKLMKAYRLLSGIKEKLWR